MIMSHILLHTSRKLLASVKFSLGKAAKKCSGSVEGENVKEVQSIFVILDQPCSADVSKARHPSKLWSFWTLSDTVKKIRDTSKYEYYVTPKSGREEKKQVNISRRQAFSYTKERMIRL